MDDAKLLAAERWYGYGRWDAPYWFIGKEPGGTDDPEQYASWLRLGGGELIDCHAHDIDCSTEASPPYWHGPEPGPHLQSTWRPLIAMLLAYQGAGAYDEHAARRYQDERWGRSDGETALLELSAIAAPSVSREEALRLTHLPQRIATIRRRLAEHRPELVVFYGLGTDPVHEVPYLQHWREIAQHDLDVDEPLLANGTAFIVERHPTAFGTTTNHWVNVGHRLRALRDRNAGGTEAITERRVPNRQLSDVELTDVFGPLLADVRSRLRTLAAGDEDLHWALRRKLFKELMYDERTKPMQRRALKAKKRKQQDNLCDACGKPLPERDAVLDRRQAMKGYTPENTRLICRECDTRIQTTHGYT